MRRTGGDTVWSLLVRASAGELMEVTDGAIDGTTPWAMLAYHAAALASRLSALGVSKGHRIAVVSANSAQVVSCLGAAAKIGAISAHLNIALTSHELAVQLLDLDPSVILAQPASVATVAEAIELADACSAALLVLDPALWETPAGEADHRPSDFMVTSACAEDPFLLLYTSGTSGRPKGVLHSHRGVVEEALRMAEAWSIRPDDVIFGHLPMFHVSGLLNMLLPGIVRDASVAIGPRFSASHWAEDARAVRATVTPMVGPQIKMIMAGAGAEADCKDLQHIRIVPYGMAVPEDMERGFRYRFSTGPLHAMSGSTECIGVSYLEPAYTEHRWPALGRPAADREVEVVSPAGQVLPQGKKGELCVRGEPGGSLMMGYWNQTEVTNESVVNGWFHTGDIGWIDEDGFIFFSERAKDVIKRSGENVSAAEVESVIAMIEGVDEVAVVGRPDPIRDESVVAFVSTRDAAVSPGSIRAYCRRRLAVYKVPEEVRIVADFPRTSIGKIEKRRLREIAQGNAAEETPQDE